MNTAQLVAALRSAADVLDGLGVEVEKYRPSVDLYFHDINCAVDLAVITRLLESRSVQQSEETHWIKGRLHGLGVAAFYTPGMLGATTQKVITVEESPDLEKFLSASEESRETEDYEL